jgi:septal ring factor EnvC (AmiA/AmiB activator)
MKKSLLLATAVTFSFLSAACASSPAPMDAGERMSQRGDDIGAYGTAWSDGQKDVAKGQESVAESTKSIAEAERDLARARADIAKAEQQIADAVAAKANAEKQIEDGTVQMARAEADYAVTKAGPSAVTPTD